MGFYHYHQNHSGGHWAFDAERGISVEVIVEADSALDANDKAERIGLYWNGCEQGLDCSCCGDRWDEQFEDEKGDPEPAVYGQLVLDKNGVGRKPSERGLKWMGDKPDGFVHFADGRVVPFWPGVKAKAKTKAKGTRSAPTQALRRRNE